MGCGCGKKKLAAKAAPAPVKTAVKRPQAARPATWNGEPEAA